MATRLLIFEANSRHPAHDGAEASFYQTLRRGTPYRGYYSVPFNDVIAVFKRLATDAKKQ